MTCYRAAFFLLVIAVTGPAAAQEREARVSSVRNSNGSSAERWLRQLANDLDHLQEDLYYERGSYPQGLAEQVDQVAHAVAHFQHVLGRSPDRVHLRRDFREMDRQIHALVNRLDQTGDSWLRRQGSRLRYADEQLHYSLQRRLGDSQVPSRELLARQAHLLESEARALEELSERVNRRDRQLRDAIEKFADEAEHFHEVVEEGADIKHLDEDFSDVDESWHRVVQLLNGSSYVYYLRSAAQRVNRVHNQIHDMVSGSHDGGHERDHDRLANERPRSAPPPPPVPPQRRPAIEFEIPGIGRFQIPR